VRLALVVVVLGSVLCVTTSSVADPWGTGTSDTGAHPDSNPHTYCYEYGFPGHYEHSVAQMENNALGDPTAATVVRESSCDYSSRTETDVVWQWRDLPGTTRGRTRCEDFDTYCDQFYVQIDFNQITSSSSPDEENIRKTMCHELGHSVGLTHGPTPGGCMVSGAVNGDLQWRRYASHHRNHINAWFG